MSILFAGLELAFKFAVMAFLCSAIAGLTARLRHSDSRPYLRKAVWIALGLAVVMNLQNLQSAIVQQPPQKQSLASTPNSLTSTEVNRYQEIIQNVMRDPDYLTPAIHDQFWALQKRTGASTSEIQNASAPLISVSLTYNRMFYEDALVSMQARRSYKSTERQALEQQMLRNGEARGSRFKSNDDLMVKIAALESVTDPLTGTELVFDEGLIRSALDSLDATFRRLDALFTPP